MSIFTKSTVPADPTPLQAAEAEGVTPTLPDTEPVPAETSVTKQIKAGVPLHVPPVNPNPVPMADPKPGATNPVPPSPLAKP
jgi:hypothetical protein